MNCFRHVSADINSYLFSPKCEIVSVFMVFPSDSQITGFFICVCGTLYYVLCTEKNIEKKKPNDECCTKTVFGLWLLITVFPVFQTSYHGGEKTLSVSAYSSESIYRMFLPVFTDTKKKISSNLQKKYFFGVLCEKYLEIRLLIKANFVLIEYKYRNCTPSIKNRCKNFRLID